MTEERSLSCCTALGARTVSALVSAFRSFVSIRVHSWLDRLFHMNTTIAEPGCSSERAGCASVHIGRAWRRVTEQQRWAQSLSAK
jgi:hypothetical protein